MATTPVPIKEKTLLAPLQTKRDILAIWGAAQGMWKKKKPDPVRWHKKMRKEWLVKLR